MALARGRKACPAAVSVTLRVVLSNIATARGR
jgi:hypothetical protein